MSRVTLAWTTSIATLAVLIAGALVNAWQAALSVSTWPLSYGHLFLPEWAGNTFYEQLHRLLVVVASALYAALALSMRRESGRLRVLLATGVVLLVGQILLGGVVVLWLDPPLVAALHLLLAIAVVIVTAWIAVAAQESAATPTAPAVEIDARNQRRARRLLALLVLQLVLGALSRHPPFGQTPFIVTMLAHAAIGLLIVVLAHILGISTIRRGATRRRRLLGWTVFLLALAQLGVGSWVFVISPEPLSPEWPPPAGFPIAHPTHVALAALLVISVGLLGRGKNGEGRGRGQRSATASEFHGTPLPQHPPSRRNIG